MRDAIRFVSPTERILHIKSLPMWNDLPASDIVPLAMTAREVHLGAGKPIFRSGDRPSHGLLLVDGRVEIRRGKDKPVIVEPPNALGFLSMLADRRIAYDAVTRSSVIALQVEKEDLRRAHEDNFRLFRRCMRMIATSAADERLSLMPVGPTTTPAGDGPKPDFVERLLWLSEVEPFREASLESVAELTRRQRLIEVEPGAVIWTAAEPSSFFLGVMSGALHCLTPGGAMTPVRSDWLVGLVDAVAQRPRPCTLVSSVRSRLVHVDIEALLAVLEDDPPLRTSLLSVLAARATMGAVCILDSESHGVGWPTVG